jgi:uncharacterized protein YjbJ (UPF0337 family)
MKDFQALLRSVLALPGTAVQNVQTWHQEETAVNEHKKAEQARKGLVDTVIGKAKEFVGAVTGNDSLTGEGQLQQTQARERKEANTVEAVADAEATQAHNQAAEAKKQGVQARAVVNAETAAAKDAVQTRQAAHKRAAELAGQRDAASEKARAELDAQRDVERAKAKEREELSAAAQDAGEAVEEHRTSVRQAATAQSEADRIRRQADSLTIEADLP